MGRRPTAGPPLRVEPSGGRPTGDTPEDPLRIEAGTIQRTIFKSGLGRCRWPGASPAFPEPPMVRRTLLAALSVYSVVLWTPGCSLMVPRTTTLTITASDPDAEIYVNGALVGRGVATPKVARNESHGITARVGDRVGAASVGTRVSALGVLDILGGILWLVPFVGIAGPGFFELDSTAVTVMVPPPSSREQSHPPPSSQDVRSATISLGSGFVIDSSGLVATCWHVLDGHVDVEVVFPASREVIKAKVIAKDTTNDLAVLRMAHLPLGVRVEAVAIGGSDHLELGARVYTVGFPDPENLGVSPKFASGEVSGTLGRDDDPRHFQVSLPIQPGNSGGALFDEQGTVVGVVVATLNPAFTIEYAGYIPQNVNFAIKAEYLLSLLRVAGVKVVGPPLDERTVGEAKQRAIASVVSIMAK